MSLLSPRGFPANEPPLPAAVRFECKSTLANRGAASLELSGELDRAVCDELEAHLTEAQRASATVVLEMRRLTFMDSAGYAVLVRAARASRPEAKLILAGCTGQVGRLLDLVGLPEKAELRRSPMPAVARTAVDASAGGPGSGASVGV